MISLSTADKLQRRESSSCMSARRRPISNGYWETATDYPPVTPVASLLPISRSTTRQSALSLDRRELLRHGHRPAALPCLDLCRAPRSRIVELDNQAARPPVTNPVIWPSKETPGWPGRRPHSVVPYNASTTSATRIEPRLR